MAHSSRLGIWAWHVLTWLLIVSATSSTLEQPAATREEQRNFSHCSYLKRAIRLVEEVEKLYEDLVKDVHALQAALTQLPGGLQCFPLKKMPPPWCSYHQDTAPPLSGNKSTFIPAVFTASKNILIHVV
jgi:hypothetical protein